jgi:transcriptional regulator with XRE-family HTH domain
MDLENKGYSLKIGPNLERLMAQKNIRLNDLSKDLSIPASTLHGWLNEAPPRSISGLKKVADYFGVTLDELCFGRENHIAKRVEVIVGELENVQLIIRKKDDL